MINIVSQENLGRVLEEWRGATAIVWMYHLSHRKMAIRLSFSSREDVLVCVVSGCKRILGPFEWDNSSFKLVSSVDLNGEMWVTVSDKTNGFELIGAGAAAACGKLNDFGDSFDNLLQK